MNKIKLTGAALAISAATMFSAAPSVALANSCSCPMVKCLTANACKGLSSCHTATNACKGQNACKGKGFVMLTKGQCLQVIGPNVNWCK
ncbi:silver efflux pump [Legionella nautarum]|uniref:Silver efflux pump n=1 Tax=Legionella nautarum TaxID=45070 RepID=A0A0W0WUG4_9GAMM|nr:hypothetical protein [Legionella nautarum]KTD35782.1 silver efflux pump [Legionella nautarum]